MITRSPKLWVPGFVCRSLSQGHLTVHWFHFSSLWTNNRLLRAASITRQPHDTSSFQRSSTHQKKKKKIMRTFIWYIKFCLTEKKQLPVEQKGAIIWLCGSHTPPTDREHELFIHTRPLIRRKKLRAGLRLQCSGGGGEGDIRASIKISRIPNSCLQKKGGKKWIPGWNVICMTLHSTLPPLRSLPSVSRCAAVFIISCRRRCVCAGTYASARCVSSAC